eukprot:6190779-Pleurochrysis_carterae.AAC.2
MLISFAALTGSRGSTDPMSNLGTRMSRFLRPMPRWSMSTHRPERCEGSYRMDRWHQATPGENRYDEIWIWGGCEVRSSPTYCVHEACCPALSETIQKIGTHAFVVVRACLCVRARVQNELPFAANRTHYYALAFSEPKAFTHSHAHSHTHALARTLARALALRFVLYCIAALQCRAGCVCTIVY